MTTPIRGAITKTLSAGLSAEAYIVALFASVFPLVTTCETARLEHHWAGEIKANYRAVDALELAAVGKGNGVGRVTFCSLGSYLG